MRGTTKIDKDIFYIVAIGIGAISLFFYGITVFSVLSAYIHQGEPSRVASEDPPAIIPPMSFSKFIFTFLPSSLGLVSSGVYFLVGAVFIFSMFRLRLCTLLYFSAWLDVIVRVPFILNMASNPLPTISQIIMMSIFFTAPIVFCGIYSVCILIWLKKQPAPK